MFTFKIGVMYSATPNALLCMKFLTFNIFITLQTVKIFNKVVYFSRNRMLILPQMHKPISSYREHDYIAFDEYYNEPIGRSFGNCDIYNTTITWLCKHDHMARYFPIFLVFGTKFQYFDNGE